MFSFSEREGIAVLLLIILLHVLAFLYWLYRVMNETAGGKYKRVSEIELKQM